MLLIVVLVLSLPLSWLGLKLRQARKHRETVNAILESGGHVGYEYNLLGLGLGEVVYVWGRDLGDAELEELKGLTSLRQLDVDGCRGVTDAGLEHLQGLNSLEWLNISHTQVTEAGLEHLKDMTNLEELYICCLYQAHRQKKISDKDVRELQEALPNCTIIGP
jgi:hypothetical protein